jgi:hypothetical protein
VINGDSGDSVGCLGAWVRANGSDSDNNTFLLKISRLSAQGINYVRVIWMFVISPCQLS